GLGRRLGSDDGHGTAGRSGRGAAAGRSDGGMNGLPILRLGTLKDVARFQDHVQSLQLKIPCDREIARGAESPLRQPLTCAGVIIGDRIAVPPMEGMVGPLEGYLSDHTILLRR